jgi:xylulokinase
VKLVAGVDSSTQSCKVVIRSAETGALVRSGSAVHPLGTEVAPEAWWQALQLALAAAGGLDDVSAISVGGQQHGMVCLDEAGAVVRPALLWNDTRSAGAAADLVDELPGGAAAWADAVGSVPVASFTVTKLRWLAEHEPDNAKRTAAVCLPHDWLTWRLRSSTDIGELTTDRGEASGTGYWSPTRNAYRDDLLQLALGASPSLPRVLAPNEVAGSTAGGIVIGPGTGDNAASALGLNAEPGDVIISIGTSGVVCAVSAQPTADASGLVAGFADASGAFLPLTATLNGARVLESIASLLGVTHDEFSTLALAAAPGADGLILVPYFEGERTPNRPDATATLYGLTVASTGREQLARAAVEGLLCGLADGLAAIEAVGVVPRRVLLIGGGARSDAVRRIAPTVLGLPLTVPEPGEYVADGAARQAAWVLSGAEAPPPWALGPVLVVDGQAVPSIRSRYAEARDHGSIRPASSR